MKSIIIYATKYGCAEKAAELLKSKLEGEVILINIMKEKVPSIVDFDNVILGGSIYIGKIQKVLANYAEANLSSLLTKKTGLFICAGQEEPIRTKELEDAFPSELFRHSAAKDVFGYEYCFDKLKFLDKLIVRKVAGITESVSELSEEKIDSFAKAMCGHR